MNRWKLVVATTLVLAIPTAFVWLSLPPVRAACTAPSSCLPTATISLSPATITVGSPTTLTWSSTNATSCTGVALPTDGGPATGWATGGKTSGSTVIYPTEQANYTITCINQGIATTQSTVVNPNVASITLEPANAHTGQTVYEYIVSPSPRCTINGNQYTFAGLPLPIGTSITDYAAGAVGPYTTTLTCNGTQVASATGNVGTATGGALTSMTITGPVTTTPASVTYNQISGRVPDFIGVSDVAQKIPAALTTFSVTAAGAGAVQVWTHARVAASLTSGDGTHWTGTVNLSTEPNGPLLIGIRACDTTSCGYPNVQLDAKFQVFLTGGTDPVIPFPAAATGMSLKFSDEFNTSPLSIAPCTAGSHPCAAISETANWYPNKSGLGDFGDAAFENPTSTPSRNPYSQINAGVGTNGWLRIRSTYDAAYVDPYGFSRHWYGGLLSSAYPDGTTNFPSMSDGYYEARVMVPGGSQGGPGVNNGGGTWSSFWLLTINNLLNSANGDIEYDIMEEYGDNEQYAQAAIHSYGTASWNGSPGSSGTIEQGTPGPDFVWEPHRYGIQILNGQCTAFLDDHPTGANGFGAVWDFGGGAAVAVPFNCAKMGNGALPKFFMLLDLAAGGGWTETVPPASYFDMWVDYVRYYSF